MKKIIMFLLITTVIFSKSYIEVISTKTEEKSQITELELFVEKDQEFQVYKLKKISEKENISVYYNEVKIYEKIKLKNKLIERSYLTGDKDIEIVDYPVKEIVKTDKKIIKKYKQKKNRKSSQFDQYLSLIYPESLLMEYNKKDIGNLKEVFPDRDSRTIKEVIKQ